MPIIQMIGSNLLGSTFSLGASMQNSLGAPMQLQPPQLHFPQLQLGNQDVNSVNAGITPVA